MLITKVSAQRRPGRYNIFLDGKYAFSASENKYVPISKEKLQSKVNNGLISDGYRNIKGIERTD